MKDVRPVIALTHRGGRRKERTNILMDDMLISIITSTTISPTAPPLPPTLFVIIIIICSYVSLQPPSVELPITASILYYTDISYLFLSLIHSCSRHWSSFSSISSYCSFKYLLSFYFFTHSY